MRKSWAVAVTALAASGLASCNADLSSGAAVASTPAVVTRTVDATTAQCPFGGTVVESGLDRDGDGALGDGEVAAQTVVCQPMPAGPPVATLIHIVDEPAGAHCVVGGTAVESGPDRDGNGVLDDSEVSHVDYLCSDVVVGDLSITGRGSEIVPYANLRAVTGSLDLEIQDLGSAIGLPKLEHVGGSMSVFGSFDIAYPELLDVNGFLLIVQAGSAQFPKLTRVGSLGTYTANLRDLSGFPALQRIDDAVAIGASQLETLDLSLDVLGRFEVDQNLDLTEITLHVNHAIGDVFIAENSVLSSLTLDVSGVSSLDVESNPHLPTCQVQAIAERLHLSNAKIVGNDDSATCAP